MNVGEYQGDIYFLVYSVSNYPLGYPTRLDEALIRNTTGWKRLLGSKSFLTVVDLKSTRARTRVHIRNQYALSDPIINDY